MFIVTLTRNEGLPKVKGTYNTFNFDEAVEVSRMFLELQNLKETCDLQQEIIDNYGAERGELTVTITQQ